MRRFNLGGKWGYYFDLCYSDYKNELIFASIYGYTAQIDQLIKKCNKRQELEISSHNKKIIKDIHDYHLKKSIDASTDLCHLVLLKKESLNPEEKSFTFHIASMGRPSNRIFYKKINSFTNIPLVEDKWQDNIVGRLMQSNQIKKDKLENYGGDPRLEVWSCSTDDEHILTLVSGALENEDLIMCENKKSSLLSEETKLDDYLTQTSDYSTERILSKFSPRFNPNKDDYSEAILEFEDWCWNDGAGILLFDAQKAVIAASVKCLEEEHRVFIVGEMGTGMQIVSI